jgi:biuret amidohydrolase
MALLELGRWGLLMVDLQRYYVEPECNFVRFFEHLEPGASDYVRERVARTVLPSLKPVVHRARALEAPLVYLRLCGEKPDRSDLHRHFVRVYREALEAGFPDLYPLSSEAEADVLRDVAPEPGDVVVDKTTYSGFTFSKLPQVLTELQLDTLVLAGLATSQCVETTARDASDRGYRVVHLEDCQADYHDISHRASLFASRNVCGGHVLSGREFLSLL